MFGKHIILKYQIALIGILALLLGCGSTQEKVNDNSTDKVSETLYDNFIAFENRGINYNVPSPMEMFLFLEKNEAPFLTHEIHKTNTANNYLTKKAMALNFGIYSADLAYCAVFGDFQRSITYFNTAKTLAKNLGMSEGFGESFSTRINANISGIDSLIEISAESYYAANQILYDQGQTDIMGLIMVGGWIEALYLTVKSIDNQNTANPIIERIADQQVLLENLLGHLHNNECSDQITEIIHDLEQLQKAFDELYFNSEKIIITKEQFVTISNEITLLRNTYTN